MLSLACAAQAFAVMPYYTGVRAEGMGGAFTSVADDNSALYYNPAGLAGLEKQEAAAMYWKDYFDTGYYSLSYGRPVNDFGGLAFGWARTANSFERADAWGNASGTADVTGDVFMLGAGYYKNLPVSVGVTAKFITEKIDTFSASGWALDAGSFVEVKPLRLGIVLQNAVSGGLKGESLAGGTASEDLPSTLRFGVSCAGGADYRALNPDINSEKISLSYLVAADIVVPVSNPGNYKLSPGAEIWLNDTVAFRAGYKESADFTTGFSLKFSGLRIDYSFIASKELENSSLFSTSIFF